MESAKSMSRLMAWRWYDVFVASGLAATIFWSGYQSKTIDIVESAVSCQTTTVISVSSRTTTLEANYSDIMRQLGRIETQIERLKK